MADSSRAAINKILRKGAFFALRYPCLLLVGWLTVILLAAWGVWHGSFGNDIARMLPDDSESGRSYRKIRESSMFNKVMILLESEDQTLFESAEFAQSYDKLAQTLQSDPSTVRRVDYRLFRGDLRESLKELPAYCMLLVTPEEVLPTPEELPGQDERAA